MPIEPRSLRSFGGLAVAIVPWAIIVHLVAEAAASGHDAWNAGFVMRHAYFVAMFALAVAWFAQTVGLGRPAAERRRRCALVCADLNGPRRPHRLSTLIAANLGFFLVTQAVEGIPILSGAVGLGLGVALAGSLLSAILVFLLGGPVVGSVLECVIGVSPFRRATPAPPADGTLSVPRRATFAYSLFVPNRPPPISSRI